MTAPLISQPGAYPDIDNADYHRNPNLLPAPSLSSTGVKAILERSPYHFWANSPMNPARPPESDESSAMRIGKAAHDMILLPERWTSHYYVLPEGFNEGHTVKQAEVIRNRDAARRRGMTILSFKESQTVEAVVESLGGSESARNALSGGVPEMTLVWQHEKTGVWLRARPDWLPRTIIDGRIDLPRIVTDLKFMAPRSCNSDGWSNALAAYGYHISAAFYDMGIEAIYGKGADAHIFIPVESAYPYSPTIYPLPAGDLKFGRDQCEEAIAVFAECLSHGTEAEHWPGYNEPEPDGNIKPVGLPPYYRRLVAEHGSRRAAAFINAVEGE